MTRLISSCCTILSSSQCKLMAAAHCRLCLQVNGAYDVWAICWDGTWHLVFQGGCTMYAWNSSSLWLQFHQRPLHEFVRWVLTFFRLTRKKTLFSKILFFSGSKMAKLYIKYVKSLYFDAKTVICCWLLYTAVFLLVELLSAVHSRIEVDYYAGTANFIITV